MQVVDAQDALDHLHRVAVDDVRARGQILLAAHRLGHLRRLRGTARGGLQHRAPRSRAVRILRRLKGEVLEPRLSGRVGRIAHQAERRIHIGGEGIAVGVDLLPVERRQDDGVAARRGPVVEAPHDRDRLGRCRLGFGRLALPEQTRGKTAIGVRGLDMRFAEAALADGQRLTIIGLGRLVAGTVEAAAANERRGDAGIAIGGERMILAEQPAADSERLDRHLGALGVPAEQAERCAEAGIGMRGLGIVVAELGAENAERLAHQRFGGFGAEIIGQVDQLRRIGGMVRARHALLDFDAAPVHRLGFVEAALLDQIMRDIAVHDGGAMAAFAERLPRDVERLAQQGFDRRGRQPTVFHDQRDIAMGFAGQRVGLAKRLEPDRERLAVGGVGFRIASLQPQAVGDRGIAERRLGAFVALGRAPKVERLVRRCRRLVIAPDFGEIRRNIVMAERDVGGFAVGQRFLDRQHLGEDRRRLVEAPEGA